MSPFGFMFDMGRPLPRTPDLRAPNPALPPPPHALALLVSCADTHPQYYSPLCSTLPQYCSPLFSTLPPEIRSHIFCFTLLKHDDESKPVPFNSYQYRPGYEYRKKYSLDLLLTCKRVYLEAYLIPTATTTHATWDDCAPPLSRPFGTPARFQTMTVEQRAAVKTVQLYARQYSLEQSGWERAIITQDHRTSGVSPTRLVITVRHTDWTHWERDEDLRMDEAWYGGGWREGFEAFPSLEEFVMELETLERRKAEMDVLVGGIKKWRINLGNGRLLSTDRVPLKTCTWHGSTQFCGGVRAPTGATSLPYYAVTITWKVRNVRSK